MSFAAATRSWAVLFMSLTALALFGCGRSSLDEALVIDGGLPDAVTPTDGPKPDAGLCNPSNCLNGCCDASGVCRSGSDSQACGTLGNQCNDCLATGFDFCDGASSACGKVVTTCDVASCPGGCCRNNLCLAGSNANACGTGASTCQNCAMLGEACDPAGQFCSAPRCGPESCPGCCVGDLCVTGADPTSCGRSGQQCQNCASQGTTCQPTFPGGVCEGQPMCGPKNCKGCCAGNTCLTGQDNTSCGGFGAQCTNCTQFGQLCSTTNFPPQCAPAQCGPQNCAGCCQGNVCIGGGTSVACGSGGAQCARCATSQQCTNGQCQGSTLCNPGNCSGCCVGDICATGGQPTACGAGGGNCINCAANGQGCQGGACVTTCGPGNCPGCCDGNVCVMGTTTAQCGNGGNACVACAAPNQCSSGLCTPPPPPCSATSCLGCCDPTQGCLPGFLATSCGSGGSACTNCTATKSSCDTALLPRTCKNQQTTCPAPYGACPGSVTTAQPPIQHVCSAVDLTNARAACIAGPASNGCLAFFAFEQANNPSCATCLAPFDVSFQEASGLFACAAPFVSAICDHSTGCASDCLVTSCGQCPAGAGAGCRNDVTQNQCSPYFQQSGCAIQAIFGPGPAAFCNPQNYNNNYGRWLQGVGGHYCGP